MANFFTKAFKGFSSYQEPLFPDSWNGSSFMSIGSFFGYDLGGRTLSKFLISYGRNPLVYMIIKRISTTTASLDRKFVDQNGDEIEGESELEMILQNPNREQGRAEFFEEIYEYFCSTGNVFIYGIEGVGMGFDLKVLNSSRMRLELDNMGKPLRWSYCDNMGREIPYELEEILHIKSSNIVEYKGSASYFGMSPLEAAWMIIKSSDEIFSAEASIFKNRGIIGILTNETDTPMLEPDRRELQTQFDKEVGGADQYNKIKISNTKLKYIQTGMSPTDLKLLEGILSKLRLLCSVFQMPSVLFNDNASSTYNNVVEAERGAHNNVYLPLGNKVDRELSIWLSNKLDLQEMMIIDRAMIEVLKASTNEVAMSLNNVPQNVAQRITSQMTRNEARSVVGLPELEDPILGAELVGDGKIMEESNGNQNG